MIQVKELWVYPIKSTRGISLQQVELVAGGLQYDRNWMVVEPGGSFLTARTHPKMLQMETQLTSEALKVSAPGMSVLSVPLARGGLAGMEVHIWSDTCAAWSMGEESARWFSEYLGLPCLLVRVSETSPRTMKPIPALEGEHVVSFADAAPCLIASEASLAALNERAGISFSMARFRPNVVVEGASAFEEDTWEHFRVGDVSLWGGKMCDRCVLTTISPETGEKGKEPLATLAAFRKWNNRVYFGMNAVPVSFGTLAVGEQVYVDTRKVPAFVW